MECHTYDTDIKINGVLGAVSSIFNFIYLIQCERYARNILIFTVFIQLEANIPRNVSNLNTPL